MPVSSCAKKIFSFQQIFKHFFFFNIFFFFKQINLEAETEVEEKTTENETENEVEDGELEENIACLKFLHKFPKIKYLQILNKYLHKSNIFTKNLTQ